MKILALVCMAVTVLEVTPIPCGQRVSGMPATAPSTAAAKSDSSVTLVNQMPATSDNVMPQGRRKRNVDHQGHVSNGSPSHNDAAGTPHINDLSHIYLHGFAGQGHKDLVKHLSELHSPPRNHPHHGLLEMSNLNLQSSKQKSAEFKSDKVEQSKFSGKTTESKSKSSTTSLMRVQKAKAEALKANHGKVEMNNHLKTGAKGVTKAGASSSDSVSHAAGMVHGEQKSAGKIGISHGGNGNHREEHTAAIGHSAHGQMAKSGAMMAQHDQTHLQNGATLGLAKLADISSHQKNAGALSSHAAFSSGVNVDKQGAAAMKSSASSHSDSLEKSQNAVSTSSHVTNDAASHVGFAAAKHGKDLDAGMKAGQGAMAAAGRQVEGVSGKRVHSVTVANGHGMQAGMYVKKD